MNRTPAESGHVARTIGALEMLAQQTHSVVSLAEGLEVHPRTVKRMLEALVQLQYVGVVGNDHGQPLYRATLKLTTLSERLLHDSDLIQISAPYVAKLRDVTGEAAHLSMGSRDGVSHVLQEGGESLVIAKPRAGEYVPFYATAVGKALLAFQDEYWEYLPEHFVPFTRHTVTSRAQLQEKLLEVRRTGISQDALENSLELRCLAAPICDATGVIAALGISAPSSRFTLDLVPHRSQQVLGIATELSAHLGGDLPALISGSGHASEYLDHQQ
ncbi:IclR family transcriptional regulator [Gulosibacter chungangensis]|uniref:IclR family transcriptional regulator n=1 Tax=Gulosibacter chungangensis TaxID=979746 RepID=A0A7J5BC57_9MICO|nr:IclR family transcriptional regulator [Gulosibacter chungangensis]KAB1642316.1 IclR family transcriptional regulator [Gulosibacter chungangensis]